MTLGDFTARSLLIPQLSSADQAGAINELSQCLQQAGRIEDSLAFFQAVLQSDYLSSSATEDGMAFLHARIRGIERLCFAMGLSRGKVRWRDGSQVHAVILIAVPPAETQLYLALVAALARLSRNAELMSSLVACTQPKGVWRLLNNVELTAPPGVRTGREPNTDPAPRRRT
jgi:mannitol/fructose-specific phosphotransferase system IIA component (Ntr-type)